ncbi:hypothetical protein [Bacillus sp. KH172YL63]|uniref:hypothetical protein n=1 Tax=Bacillus sp. KH172YL63 TaxID=2709784 RepID=UPI0013E4C9C9|nr:hypothetical protein [Bacillus sp. KH172YL63]BCB02568.1 hypothetical protein KH172YL63_07010 [Bacillus sp. KH172YL63]
MKLNMIVLMLSLVFLLSACNGSDDPEGSPSPEEALKKIGNEERNMTVYGTYKVNDDLVLFVFRGAMNEKDIWIADVHREDGRWTAQGIVQMNGPIEGNGDRQTVIVNEEDGYEAGYITSAASDTEDLKMIDIDGVGDWKIWFK